MPVRIETFPELGMNIKSTLKPAPTVVFVGLQKAKQLKV